jgi:hypothetical protein
VARERVLDSSRSLPLLHVPHYWADCFLFRKANSICSFHGRAETAAGAKIVAGAARLIKSPSSNEQNFVFYRTRILRGNADLGGFGTEDERRTVEFFRRGAVLPTCDWNGGYK